MPTHMSTLGFQAATREDFASLARKALEGGQTIALVDGASYHVWSPGKGIQLWVQVDPAGSLIGLNPHFNGPARMQVGLTQRIARSQDTALDGAFYGWAGSSVGEPEGGDYPFVFDAPDFRTHDTLPLPAVVSVQLAAFAHRLTAYADAEALHASGSRMAEVSCIPTGTFSNPPKSEMQFHGYVVKMARLTNPYTSLHFYWTLVRTLGGEVDVVADPQVVEGEIVEQGVVGVSAWISGLIK